MAESNLEGVKVMTSSVYHNPQPRLDKDEPSKVNATGPQIR